MPVGTPVSHTGVPKIDTTSCRHYRQLKQLGPSHPHERLGLWSSHVVLVMWGHLGSKTIDESLEHYTKIKEPGTKKNHLYEIFRIDKPIGIGVWDKWPRQEKWEVTA